MSKLSADLYEAAEQMRTVTRVDGDRAAALEAEVERLERALELSEASLAEHRRWLAGLRRAVADGCLVWRRVNVDGWGHDYDVGEEYWERFIVWGMKRAGILPREEDGQ